MGVGGMWVMMMPFICLRVWGCARCVFMCESVCVCECGCVPVHSLMVSFAP